MKQDRTEVSMFSYKTHPFGASDSRRREKATRARWVHGISRMKRSSVSNGRNRVGSHDKLPFVPVTRGALERSRAVRDSSPFLPATSELIYRNYANERTNDREDRPRGAIISRRDPNPLLLGCSRDHPAEWDYPLKNCSPTGLAARSRGATRVGARVPRGMAMIQ